MAELLAPVAAAIANAGTQATIRAILSDEANEQDEWRAAAIETATEMQAAFNFYHDHSQGPALSDIQSRAENLGLNAEKLAVIGKQREYQSKEVTAVESLAKACAQLLSVDPQFSKNSAEQFRECISDAVDGVFEIAENTDG